MIKALAHTDNGPLIVRLQGAVRFTQSDGRRYAWNA